MLSLSQSKGRLLGRTILLAVVVTAPARRVNAETSGQADIAVQGYYLGVTGVPVSQTTGTSMKFQQLLPFGLLSGSIEAYGTGPGMRYGENIIELRNMRWRSRQWSVRAGDLRVPTMLLEARLTNIVYPELMVRGAQVTASSKNAEYSIFAGVTTLQDGPRLPFRSALPQQIAGASARYQVSPRVRAAFRSVAFRNNPDRLSGAFFRPGLDRLTLSGSGNAQVTWSPFRTLHINGDVTAATGSYASPIRPKMHPLSFTAAMSLERRLMTLRMNYVDQSPLILPAAGYYAGDRRGPYAELRLRPVRGFELFGSASMSSNNGGRDPELPTFRGNSASAGVSLALPRNFSGSAQAGTVRFTVRTPEARDERVSVNQFISASAGKLLGRNSLRATGRQFYMRDSGQKQQSLELEDLVQWRRVVAGGAVRVQQTAGTEQRTSLFYRGSGQVRFGPANIFGQLELGNDIVNRTLFATNTFSTSAVGLSVRLPAKLELSADAFRNRLLVSLNPESVFLMQSGGVPVVATLSNYNQWSLFLRISRQLRWGKAVDSDVSAISASHHALTGTIDGFVTESRVAGPVRCDTPIPVTLDGERTVWTDSEGRYRFTEVPEGTHAVAVSPAELPAEFDPSGTGTSVNVRAGRVSRADFGIFRLVSMTGRVTALDDTSVEGIFIRLLPGVRYTSTDAQGNFAFHNVREGDYRVSVDVASLPAGVVVANAAETAVQPRIGTDVAELHFAVRTQRRPKPVRRVLEMH